MKTRRHWLRKAGLAAIAVASAAGVYALGYRRFVADRVVRRTEVRTIRMLSLPEDRRPAIARLNIAVLESVSTGSPDDQRIVIAEAANYLLLGRHSEARALYEKALSWGKRPEIYLNLATAQAGAGDRAGAIESLTRLIHLDPIMLSDTPLAELREVALERYAKSAPPSHTADVYLNLSIGYLTAGLNTEAVSAAARGAMFDSTILTRRELIEWGGPAYEAMYRYRDLKHQKTGAQP